MSECVRGVQYFESIEKNYRYYGPDSNTDLIFGMHNSGNQSRVINLKTIQLCHQFNGIQTMECFPNMYYAFS